MKIKILLGSILALMLTCCNAVDSRQSDLVESNAVATDASSFDARVDRNDPLAFQSIAAAIDAAPDLPLKPYRIAIAAGDYYEKLVVNKPNLQFIGAGQELTRIYFDTWAGQPRPGTDSNWGTTGSATMTITAPAFVARNLHIENSFDFPANELLADTDPQKEQHTQAVAVKLEQGSDRALFEDVTISGYQDTLYTQAGRSLFRRVIIKGHVDFIFGAGTAVFLDSEIVTRARPTGEAPIGYVTAPSTDIETRYGLVFINSRLLREDGVSDNSMALGRPWHPTTSFPDGRYADPQAIGQAVFINCWMDAHIQARPWYPMQGTARDGSRLLFQPQDARFFEFASRGPGALENPTRRRLSEQQAKQFTLANIFADWQPPEAVDARSVTPRFSEEYPDYSIEREYTAKSQQYPNIRPIKDATPNSVVAHRDLVYRRIDDRGLHLDLFRPAATEQPAAAVVMVHGGGWRSGDRSHWIPMAQALAAAGYVGVAVEYQLSREALYPAAVHDVQAAIRWLRHNSEQYGIDPSRIAVLGASAGAHMATLIGSVGHLPVFAGQDIVVNGVDSSVQAIINVDGIAEVESPAVRAFEDKPGKISYFALWLGGRFAEQRDLWREASPLQYAGPHTPPTLFINSAQPRFHMGRDELIARLARHDIHGEVHTLPDSPHSFWLFHPWFDQTRDYLIGFLQRVFGPDQ